MKVKNPERSPNNDRQSDPLSIAVIGAGLAGLVAARMLTDHGHRVEVFEKARGVGGRMSRRREGDYAFDHGAQYFAVRDPSFARQVKLWTEAGIVSPWNPSIAVARHGELTAKPQDIERYVGVPGMNAVTKYLASGLQVVLRTRVERIIRSGAQWHLAAELGNDLGRYDVVLVSTPPEQAAPLLTPEAPHLARKIQSVQLAPCWAVLLAFDETLAIPFDGLFLHDSPLSWAARNSSKPGRPATECWVLHGTPHWSGANMDRSPGAVIDTLIAAFFAGTGAKPVEPVFAKAHRWRFSIAENPLQEGCLWDPELRLGSCGDWCQGSRVEGAFLSGMASAEQVLALH